MAFLLVVCEVARGGGNELISHSTAFDFPGAGLQGIAGCAVLLFLELLRGQLPLQALALEAVGPLLMAGSTMQAQFSIDAVAISVWVC